MLDTARMIHVASMALLALSLNQTPNEDPAREESRLAVIRRHMPQIANCYDRVRHRSPSPQGEVLVEWLITPSGDVSKAAVTHNTTGSAELADCILREVKSWTFPGSHASSPTPMSHPFRFQSS